MPRRGSSGGLSSFLALIAIGLIITGIVFAVRDSDNNKKAKEPEKAVQKEDSQDYIKSLNLGDGKLKSASSVGSTEFKKGTVKKGPLVKTSSKSSGKSSCSTSSG